MTEPLSLVKEPDPEDPPETAKTVDFMGETFALNDDVSDFAVMEFAEAAASGEDAGTMQGMASLLRFVLELVAESDRDRFRSLARRKRVKFDDLVKFIMGETEAETARPTGPSADSSDGREITEPRSGVNYAGKVYPLAGRPDLQLVIEQARVAQAG